MARQLLGPAVEVGDEHAIFKPARHFAGHTVHQDEAYWDPAFLSVWMPQQEATIENGCLHFVPKSHQSDVAPHRAAATRSAA